jgi:hypothetical protein
VVIDNFVSLLLLLFAYGVGKREKRGDGFSDSDFVLVA